MYARNAVCTQVCLFNLQNNYLLVLFLFLFVSFNAFYKLEIVLV